jgi:hypothetical protein
MKLLLPALLGLAPLAADAFLGGSLKSRGGMGTMHTRARARAWGRGPVAMKADWALLFDCDGVLADTERDGKWMGIFVFSRFGFGSDAGIDDLTNISHHHR